jgi:DNA-binding FadR family transcriptional regulator
MNIFEGHAVKRSPNLSEQIAGFISDGIEKGSLRPGEILPSEAGLSERFKVSRSVIREALGRLKYDGLLVSRQGSKSVVAEPDQLRVFRLEGLNGKDLNQVRSLYEFRAVLESQAALLAAKRRTQKNLDLMQKCIDIMDEAVMNGLDGTDANTDFHLEIVKASGNSYLEQFMSFFTLRIREQIQADRNLSGYFGLPATVQHEHKRIFNAIVEKSPDRAREELLNHLKSAAKRRGLAIFEG